MGYVACRSKIVHDYRDETVLFGKNLAKKNDGTINNWDN